MENSFQNFTFYILQTSKLIQKIKNIEMREFGLKSVHVMCIVYLDKNPQGLTGTELAHVTLEDKAAISRSVATLRERGIIEREGGRYNGQLFLTPKGKELAKYIDRAAENAVMAGGDGLTDEDVEAFYRVIGKITNNLRDYYNSLDKTKDDEDE